MPDFLSLESIRWSIMQLKFGKDNDLLPRPFEADLICRAKDRLEAALREIDLSQYQTRPSRRYMFPKPNGAYRSVVQIDPIDSVLYRAIAFEIAGQVEIHRPPIDSNQVFSHRVLLREKGGLFSGKPGYRDFVSRAKELAEDKECNYVVELDLADFYNQLNLHTVGSGLQRAGIQPQRAANIKNLLAGVAGRIPRGLPVGYEASSLMSEAALLDLDQFLGGTGPAFCRYADDIRIFSKSSFDLTKTVHDLCLHLNDTYRLNLQEHKTRFHSADSYLSDLNNELTSERKLDVAEHRLSVMRMLSLLSVYPGESEGSDEKISLDHDDLAEELLEEALSTKPAQVGLARRVFQYSARTGSTRILSRTLENIPRLLVALPQMCAYFMVLDSLDIRTLIAEKLLSVLHFSNASFLPVLREWFLDVLIHRAPPELGPQVQRAAQVTSIRHSALAAKRFRFLDQFLSLTDMWDSLGPWERRGLIWASTVLPSRDRNEWLGRIRTGLDILDEIIIEAVLAVD